jgi:hypothetical protein
LLDENPIGIGGETGRWPFARPLLALLHARRQSWPHDVYAAKNSFIVKAELSVRIVDEMIPPMTTVANGRCTSAPAEGVIRRLG